MLRGNTYLSVSLTLSLSLYLSLFLYFLSKWPALNHCMDQVLIRCTPSLPSHVLFTLCLRKVVQNMIRKHELTITVLYIYIIYTYLHTVCITIFKILYKSVCWVLNIHVQHMKKRRAKYEK